MIQRKCEVLIHGFGCAKGFLDAALEWREPRIGKNNEDVLPLFVARSGGM